MARFHERYRSKKTGRTGYVSQSVIGRWKVQDQMWVQDQTANTYLNKVAGRIGWAKAGWLKAYTVLGGIRAAAWITRHGTQKGGYTDGTANTKPFIKVWNDTGWAQRDGNADAVMRRAVADRSIRMKSYFETQMRLAAQGKGYAGVAAIAS